MYSEDSMKSKDLLVICHSYNNFQKNCIEGTSLFFRNITALVRTNPFAELSGFLPIPYLEGFKKSYKIDEYGKPQNISVMPTPVWYLPRDRDYKSLGNKHLAAVDSAIRNHQLNFDLVHAQFTWSAGYVGARLKEKYGTPFIVTARGYDIYSLPFKDKEWRERIEYVLNMADCITTVSRSNLDCIRKLNVSIPVEVIPNGFRTDLFTPKNVTECRAALNLPLDKKIVLTVGNLEPIKGHKHLVDAINILLGERNDVLCIIVGVGRLKNVLKQQIRSLNLDDSVILVGGRPHNAIPDWMNACDVFVLPSLNEGNPNVMFEALGCGKPFVGSAVGGVPDIVTSEKYGLLVEPGNSSELAQKINMALDKEWDRRNIVRYARQFSREEMSERMIGVYSKVLEIAMTR